MPRRKKTAAPPPRKAAAVPSLRYWRRVRNLSVAELRDELRARDCWVSAPLIYHWENGTRECALIYARILAAILDVQLEALLAAPPERERSRA